MANNSRQSGIKVGHDPSSDRPQATAQRAVARGDATPELSVVLPTKNEVDNVVPLMARLEAALGHVDVEIIFVDDSDDGTAEAATRAGRESAFEVVVIHREPADRVGGLSGAVVTGMRRARAEWVCVMDADLQHPPEVIQRLLDRAAEGDVDLVAASRFQAGADAAHGLGPARRLVSRTLIGAAHATLPGSTGAVTDPLTGFFLVRRERVDLDALTPRGFKILLEIIGRTPGLRVAEIGFEFGTRHAGESKASVRQVLHYLSQLGHLRFRDVFMRFGRFGTVGLTGLVVNTFLFWVLSHEAGLHYLAAAAFATQLSTLWNLVLTEKWVYGGRSFRRGPATRAGAFYAMNNLALVLRAPILVALVAVVGMPEVAANVVSLVALTVMRFAVSDAWIWAEGDRTARHSYDIHGIVTVQSDVRLPELERFGVPALSAPPTISVRMGHVPRGNGTALEQGGEQITYREFPGNLGFATQITIGDDQTRIVASRVLRISPHVLYTNIVEPVLRWTFVKKGYALVHAASVANGDEGFLITARTDTGKTTTILKTLDNLPWSFIADDLTLVSPDHRLLTYPKPLTISRHTVSSVKAPLLSRWERATLPVQSRLHSRGGRKIGLALARPWIPVATLNMIVQALIPPPKYHVDRLIPDVNMASRARLGGLVIIQRGGDGNANLDPAEALEILLENCDDAYTFPPYSTLAPVLQERARHDLRPDERGIMAQALDGVPATLIRSETMDWWRRLPGLLDIVPGASTRPLFAAASGPSNQDALVVD